MSSVLFNLLANCVTVRILAFVRWPRFASTDESFEGHTTLLAPAFLYFSTRNAAISVRVEASSSNRATVAMTSSTRAAERRALA